jgi:hypothetical protein
MFHQMNGSNDDIVDIEFEINNESNHDPPSPEAHTRSPEVCLIVIFYKEFKIEIDSSQCSSASKQKKK